MRLPWGILSYIVNIFLKDSNFTVLGCLSVEDRCCIVPIQMFSDRCKGIKVLEILDPADAWPDYSEISKRKIEKNRQRLKQSGVNFESLETALLDTEDQLIDIFQIFEEARQGETVIFDISSMPKRYFCFLIKRFLLNKSLKNLVVTYTSAGTNGYTKEHLAEDPMSCDHLPGYCAQLPPKGDTLVLSVGYESLSLRTLIEIYKYKRENTKIILPFPPDGNSSKRTWGTLTQLASGNANNIDKEKIEVIATWDTELVYRTLERWWPDSNGLTLAPFGPKPHSLGLALFATKFDCGLFYTQPKSYNPEYCKGHGEIWAYVLKWDGIPCFDRS